MPERSEDEMRQALRELQTEIKLLQEAVGMLMGMVMVDEDGPDEQMLGGAGDPKEPHFRFNVGM